MERYLENPHEDTVDIEDIIAECIADDMEELRAMEMEYFYNQR